ncbi:MAG: hypothetical protein ACREMI_13765 [Gemmatimonadales bacterium]
MLSLLLITALAVQYPPPASKPAQDTTAPKRTATVAPRGTSQAVVGRQAFHDRMRELWSDHIVYTRNFIVSSTAGLSDTAEVLQRLLRNQDEIGEAIKPYYGEAAGGQLASLLRSHIQLAGKALVAAKGTQTAQAGMHQDMYLSSRMGDTTSRTDTIRINSQNPNPRMRMDTTKARAGAAKQHGNVRSDTAAPADVYAQGQVQVQASQQAGQQAGQVDSVAVNQAIVALRANGDSIAMFLSQANPRGFAREPLRAGFQMHIDLLLKGATAHIKKDWAGSVAAFDESVDQGQQMADMLSEGIMKQFPSRFNNKTAAVSSR